MRIELELNFYFKLKTQQWCEIRTQCFFCLRQSSALISMLDNNEFSAIVEIRPHKISIQTYEIWPL